MQSAKIAFFIATKGTILSLCDLTAFSAIAAPER